MADNSCAASRRAVVLGPGEGRTYPMGRISTIFKADGEETAHAYAVSEWWLALHTTGPGVHSHPEDDVFYVLSGTMSVLIDTEWVDADAGSFVLVPGKVTHDFENRGPVRAGILNLKASGNFEQEMPGIVQYFAEHPPSDCVFRPNPDSCSAMESGQRSDPIRALRELRLNPPGSFASWKRS